MHRLLLILGLGILMACQNGGGNVQIDYVDFVQFGGITYVAAWTSPGRPLQEGDLGAGYARVKVKLEGSQDPGHRPQDGDASFLDPGTPVFQVKGYRPTFRLAAHDRGRLTLYEADTNTKAKVGADLVDLVEKVAYIGINSSQDGHTEVAAIREPVQVEALVNMVLTSPVNQTRDDHAGLQYFIDFHLRDGTETTRSYWPQSGELSRGMMLPSAFASAVTSAVSGGSSLAEPSPPGGPCMPKLASPTRSGSTRIAARIALAHIVRRIVLGPRRASAVWAGQSVPGGHDDAGRRRRGQVRLPTRG